MRNYLVLVTFISLCIADDRNDNVEVIPTCKDVDGALHKIGDSYIGPDACNQCKCLEGGSACTKRFCPKDISSRSAEAFKCVDNMGVLHEENQTYTHVDGCNSCKCGKHGGACTRRFCVKKEKRTISSCVDADGNEKALNEAWPDKDGCNNCVCGILGAVCSEMVCGEHRLYVSEEDQVKVHELIHKEGDTMVDEAGEKPCYDMKNNTQWPGNSWLSDDSCNICTCLGNGSEPQCTRMGCRVRLERLLQSNLSGGGSTQFPTLVRISIIFCTVFVAFM